jgi:hypothetical protein
VANNWGNGDVDANGRGGRRSGGEEVKADVEWAFGGVVWESTCRFTLDVVLGSDQARERGEELGDGEYRVADVVVEWAFMEFAGEKVVSAGIELFFAVAAGGWGQLVKQG